MNLVSNLFTPFATELSDLVDKVRRSVVLVSAGKGHGSGVIWESEGLIITNDHVVSGNHAQVELTDGRTLRASVIARDEKNDLAAYRVEARHLPAVTLGDSVSLRVGELILAVGNPFGVRGGATLGIVSGVGNATWMGRARRELLHADVALAPGNSGGPLTDSAGRVLGIASMIVSPGIAIAIPAHIVTQFVTTETRRKAA